MITEAMIKAALDGHFFVVGILPGEEARMVVRDIDVDVDYIPDHRPSWDYAVEITGEMHHNAVKFTREEDDEIVRLRQGGARWADVAKAIHRCMNLTRDRYKMLCLERGLEPVRRIPNPKKPEKFSDAVKDQMVAMRDSGLSYEKLAVQFGTSKWTVADTIARRRKKMREAA